MFYVVHPIHVVFFFCFVNDRIKLVYRINNTYLGFQTFKTTILWVAYSRIKVHIKNIWSFTLYLEAGETDLINYEIRVCTVCEKMSKFQSLVIPIWPENFVQLTLRLFCITVPWWCWKGAMTQPPEIRVGSNNMSQRQHYSISKELFLIPAIHQAMQFIWMILEVIILPFNFQLPLTISDHIIETLNHNNTYEDSSNPGEDEFFHL